MYVPVKGRPAKDTKGISKPKSQRQCYGEKRKKRPSEQKTHQQYTVHNKQNRNLKTEQ